MGGAAAAAATTTAAAGFAAAAGAAAAATGTTRGGGSGGAGGGTGAGGGAAAGAAAAATATAAASAAAAGVDATSRPPLSPLPLSLPALLPAAPADAADAHRNAGGAPGTNGRKMTDSRAGIAAGPFPPRPARARLADRPPQQRDGNAATHGRQKGGSEGGWGQAKQRLVGGGSR